MSHSKTKKLFLIFALSFVLNFCWENVHSVLYISYQGAPITEFVLLRAALVDAIILTVLAVPFMQFPFWQRRKWLILPLGIFLAIVIELWALRSGRWVYTTSMPLVPFLNVGLTPTIQFAILGYGIYVLLL